jgi:hypothetical protein
MVVFYGPQSFSNSVDANGDKNMVSVESTWTGGVQVDNGGSSSTSLDGEYGLILSLLAPLRSTQGSSGRPTKDVGGPDDEDP